MCGRYVLKRGDLEALVRQFGVRSLEEWHSRFNIAPTSIVPLLRKPANAPLEVVRMRWGLIPAWTKPDAPPRPLVNLRAETLGSRFRGALKTRRCILPASGFYEWEQLGTKKQPWFFAARDGGPIGLAGVWDSWRGADGIDLQTCTVITTMPNGVLRPIHDRMPVVLTPEQSRAWIEAEDPAVAVRLLASAPDEAITAVKVGPAVSSIRNDGPECLMAAREEPDETGPQLSLGI